MRPIPRNLISLAILAIVPACASFPPTLVEEGIVKIDVEETRLVQAFNTTVNREDEQTVVRGEAKYPIWVQFGTFRGHMDIDLAVPNGEAIKKRDIQLIRKRIPKKSGRRAFFVARFPVDPLKGTIVRIRYHEGTHSSRPS